MTTPTATAQSIFTTLGNQLLQDATTTGQSLLEGYFTAINNNPTSANVVAQSLLIAAQAPLALPNLETTAIQQVAQAGLALVALLKAPAV